MAYLPELKGHTETWKASWFHQATPKKTKPLPTIPTAYRQQEYDMMQRDIYSSFVSYSPLLKEPFIYYDNSRERGRENFVQYNHCQQSAPFYAEIGDSRNEQNKSNPQSKHNIYECDRQITVQSSSADYMVWIKLDPRETGKSIAEKIHSLATFYTEEVLTVTTASGRPLQLNRTPVFQNWTHFEDFKDGETWTFTCGPLNRTFKQKLISKLL